MSHPPKTSKLDPLKPSLSLLTKLASIAAHADEMLSIKGHLFDRIALEAVLHDPEVAAWIKAMAVYVPVKR